MSNVRSLKRTATNPKRDGLRQGPMQAFVQPSPGAAKARVPNLTQSWSA